MKRKFTIFAITFCLTLSGCNSLNTYPIEYYEVKAHGAPPQMKARMISDHSSIRAGQSFKLGLFFSLQEGYYTYGAEKGQDNLPTDLNIRLPDGFSMIEESWPELKVKQGKTAAASEKIYDCDFEVIYTILAPSVLAEEIIIRCSGSWQVCRAELCAIGGGEFELILETGKKKKSELFRIFQSSYQKSY